MKQKGYSHWFHNRPGGSSHCCWDGADGTEISGIPSSLSPFKIRSESSVSRQKCASLHLEPPTPAPPGLFSLPEPEVPLKQKTPGSIYHCEWEMHTSCFRKEREHQGKANFLCPTRDPPLSWWCNLPEAWRLENGLGCLVMSLVHTMSLIHVNVS